ncbi:MFS transporter [Labedella endophytica]|uniref:MFS transporter n=1 Tax=Labedella endophytica TaxID=1523160 RepID=A0A433JPY4_9MICO|nr:MFS transporter [Labedella endophytica]RUQ98246.1 MFS transporter [Labedella endophytica]
MSTTPPNPEPTRASTPPDARTGILAGGLALTTVGTCALITLAAFESLAVTTIMPVVSDELGGASLYSLAFAAPIASSVVGMVGAGIWADRRGPARPLVAAIVVFTIGLIVAGLALAMPALVAGRFVQGFGSGAMTVSIYVLVAKLYPPPLHPKIFAAFAAAWVVPSLVGPLVAGIVADTAGWRWVFLGVVALVAAAGVLVAPALRSLGRNAGEPELPNDDGAVAAPGTRRPLGATTRLGLSAAVAVAVVTLSLSAELPDATRWFAGAAALVAIAVLVRPLLPPGTFTARRGLPSAVLLRGLIAATFFTTEVYLPLLLHDRYGLPPWLSGVTLTAGAIAWASGSAIQGRAGDSVPHRVFMRVGGSLLFAGTVVQVVTAAFMLHPVVAVIGWFLAGAGMGLMFPRITTIVLASSDRGEEGRNTSALSLSEAVGASVSLALSGLVFTLMTAASPVGPVISVGTFPGQFVLDDGTSVAPFVATLGYTAVVALIALAVAFVVGLPSKREARDARS